jgi:hypothetical protein
MPTGLTGIYNWVSNTVLKQWETRSRITMLLICFTDWTRRLDGEERGLGSLVGPLTGPKLSIREFVVASLRRKPCDAILLRNYSGTPWRKSCGKNLVEKLQWNFLGGSPAVRILKGNGCGNCLEELL